MIELHLDSGILASKPEGVNIACGDPLWLVQGAGP